MDRRDFIRTLMASGVLGANPLVSQAASELFASDTEQPVLIVGQRALPHAAALVARLVQLLAAAGVQSVQAAAGASELMDSSRVSALLDRVPGNRVIGVMDDAAALIFQELAAARGAACIVNTHHRFAAHGVRHCCTSAGLDASIAWSDSLPDHAERISRLYAATIGGRGSAAGRSAKLATADSAMAADATPGSLVSFLINI